MHGELAQAIALVAHGNRFLHEVPPGPATELFRSNSTFENVKVLKFLNIDQFAFASNSELLTVENQTMPWFEDLRMRGAKRLLLFVARGTGNSGLPEVVSVAFAGSGRWVIQVDFEHQFELWVPIWIPPGSNEKGWLVAYRRHTMEKPEVVPASSLDVPEKRLVETIQRNRDFASEALTKGERPPEAFSFFIKMFDRALSFSKSDDPKPSYEDMLPESGYGLRSRRLVAVASNAWVFGGMGWWNDMQFDDGSLQNTHSQLVADLYSAVVEGLVAGVNSFDKGSGKG